MVMLFSTMGIPGIDIGVKLALDNLDDMELATFNNILGWEDDTVRQMCEERPWFEHVKDLFTEDGGKKIHSETRASINAVVANRLEGK